MGGCCMGVISLRRVKARKVHFSLLCVEFSSVDFSRFPCVEKIRFFLEVTETLGRKIIHFRVNVFQALFAASLRLPVFYVKVTQRNKGMAIVNCAEILDQGVFIRARSNGIIHFFVQSLPWNEIKASKNMHLPNIVNNSFIPCFYGSKLISISA